MKKVLESAIETSKDLYRALEKGEMGIAQGLAKTRDDIIRKLPLKQSSNDAEKSVDQEFEALMHELMELDLRIEMLANGIKKRQSNDKVDANQQKINKQYSV